MYKLPIILLKNAEKYILSISIADRVKIRSAIKSLSIGDFESVRIKQLREQVRELLIKQHRIIFFEKSGILYIVSGFRKKTMKTPRNEIEYAEKLYKDVE